MIVMVMGLSGHQEGEGHDRSTVDCGSEKVDTLALPGCQTDLVSVACCSYHATIANGAFV